MQAHPAPPPEARPLERTTHPCAMRPPLTPHPSIATAQQAHAALGGGHGARAGPSLAEARGRCDHDSGRVLELLRVLHAPLGRRPRAYPRKLRRSPRLRALPLVSVLEAHCLSAGMEFWCPGRGFRRRSLVVASFDGRVHSRPLARVLLVPRVTQGGNGAARRHGIQGAAPVRVQGAGGRGGGHACSCMESWAY
jgi:hypothetical protein